MSKIHQKLLTIQTKLKAHKSQYNSFGKYNYRSLEDIYEALKPLLEETKTTLVVKDDLEVVKDIIFRKSTAILRDTEGEEEVTTSTYAQECLERKGMSQEQCSGSTSSYNTKYCLNKLFCIDDTKDADTDEMEKQINKPQGRAPITQTKVITPQVKTEPTQPTEDVNPTVPEVPARRRVAVPTEEVKPTTNQIAKTAVTDEQW